MTENRCIKCMANGNPSVFSVAPGTNVHLFVDMTGEYDVTFASGILSIPIENAQDYECYELLPQQELELYFHSLLSRAMSLLSMDTKNVDLCQLQAELLSEHWAAWLRAGYVHRNTVRPTIMALLNPRKKTWI